MKKILLFLLITVLTSISVNDLNSRPRFNVSGDLLRKPLTSDSIEKFPVPKDFRNYFLLQCIENETRIVIGDFVGTVQTICLIVDHGNDNKIDKIYEYYPGLSRRAKVVTKPRTPLFEGIKKTKKDILTGEINKYSYSYKMYPLSQFEKRVSNNSGVLKFDRGYRVRVPSRTSGVYSGEMFFANILGGYHLKMRTNFYYIYKSVIYPAVPYQVYCENTTDPDVKEVVEKLIKEIRQYQ